MSDWHLGALSGFDTETTSPDPETARIVSAAVVHVLDGSDMPRIIRRKWLVAVDEEIPQGAVAVHGITTERARAEGRPLAEVLPEIVAALRDGMQMGPVVVYNCPYDCTLLGRELDRCGMDQVDVAPVIDPLLLDIVVDKWRKPKKLKDVCLHYGVELGNAHDACADAMAAVGVARKIAMRKTAPTYARIAGLDPAALHAKQPEWYREDGISFQAWMRKNRDSAFTKDLGWPVTEAFATSVRAMGVQYKQALL